MRRTRAGLTIGLAAAALAPAAIIPVAGAGHGGAQQPPPAPTGVDPDALAAACKALEKGSADQRRCAVDAIPKIQSRVDELGVAGDNLHALNQAMLRLGEMGILGLGPDVGPDTKPSKLLRAPGPSVPLREPGASQGAASERRAGQKRSHFHPVTVICALGVGKVRYYQGGPYPAGVANSGCNTITTTHSVTVLLYRYSGGWYVDNSAASGGPPNLQAIAVSHNRCGNYYAYGQHYYSAVGHVPPSFSSADDTPIDLWCNT